ncbi:MetQ/NlpA family ABC transporter substrate-binding protein [Gallicola sp. Sow4_E12]|uniref:MetQ/NlpA family ABC transporter substrate-binding protein n=1 Tax=Gallicola sp. Sow4_E12 TaxID=3438785 RepID=UPI003F8F4C61
MKKKVLFSLLMALSVFFLASCGGTNNEQAATNTEQEAPAGEAKTVKIAVSPEPHAAIVEQVKEDLAAEGITLEIVEFDDYVIPNTATSDKEVDLNFFQHEPYFDNFVKENNITNLVKIGAVHLEPIGVYSAKYKSLSEVQDGDEVIIPNDATNGGRALLLLEKEGLIKLDDNTNLAATEANIVENNKNLKFTAMEAASIPSTYQEAGLAVINSNYALGVNLNPLNDSLAIEATDSPYANIVVARTEDADKPEIKKVMEALNSEKVKKYIEDTYKGAILPVF